MDLPSFQLLETYAASSEPENFYLGDGELYELYDAKASAGGGGELPLHSQVLSLHSGVLRSLFVAEAEKDREAGAKVSPQPRRRIAVHPSLAVSHSGAQCPTDVRPGPLAQPTLQAPTKHPLAAPA